MDQKLINWTHWYEIYPGYAQKCIILNNCGWPFGAFRRVLLDDGCVCRARANMLIPFMGKIPKKGSLAICGIGCLGLITEDGMREVEYPDGNKGMAYVGIHLTDKVCAIGAKWSSRKPIVVSHVSDFIKSEGEN